VCFFEISEVAEIKKKAYGLEKACPPSPGRNIAIVHQTQEV
jgi:hypothetical protein